MSSSSNTHSTAIGYIVWFLGFLGAHRFYYGKKVSGTIYFCTLGLLFVGWIIDLFLIPGMDSDADEKYTEGHLSYTIGWILMTYGWFFGIHRFYMGKWISGLLYAVSGGLFGIGYLYDLWTLNEQIDECNRTG